MTVLSKEQAQQILDKAKQPDLKPTNEVTTPDKPALDTTVGNNTKDSTAAVDAQQDLARVQNAIVDRAGKFLKPEIIEDLKEALKRNPTVPPSVLGEIVVHLKHSANPGKELMENGVGFSKLIGLVNVGATSPAAQADSVTYASLFPSRTTTDTPTEKGKTQPDAQTTVPPEKDKDKTKPTPKPTPDPVTPDPVATNPTNTPTAKDKEQPTVVVPPIDQSQSQKEQTLPPVDSRVDRTQTDRNPEVDSELVRMSVKRSEFKDLVDMDFLQQVEKHKDYDVFQFELDDKTYSIKSGHGKPVVIVGTKEELAAFDRLRTEAKYRQEQEDQSQDERHDRSRRRQGGGSIFGDIADVLTEGGDVIDAITGKGRRGGGIGEVLTEIGDVVDIFTGDRDDRHGRNDRRYRDRDRDRDRDWGRDTDRDWDRDRDRDRPWNRDYDLNPEKMGRKEFDRLFERGLLSQSGPLLESNPPKATFEFRHRGDTYEVTMTLGGKVEISGDQDALDALTEMRERELDVYYGER